MRTRTRSVVTATSAAVPPSSGTPELKRRRFLFTLGLGGAGAAMSAAASVAAVAEATAEPAQQSADGRYQDTEHVRHYYRTAKL